MSRRQNHAGGDSFDLFLDTICNTFGGIVFLAILVALLAKVRHDPSAKDAVAQVDAAAMRNLQSELEEQTARLRELELVRDSLPPPSFDPQLVEMVVLSDELNSVRDRNRKYARDRDQLGESLGTIAAESLELEAAAVDAAGLVEAARQRLEESRTAWKSSVVSAGQTLKVPVQQRSSGTRAMVALSGGELFLIASPDYLPGQFFDRHVIASKVGTNSYRIELRVGNGLTMGGPKSMSALEGTARRLSSSGSSLVVIAYPDSYHHFATVRDAFKRNGMNYELWVWAEHDPIQFSYGKGDGRVQ